VAVGAIEGMVCALAESVENNNIRNEKKE